MSKIALVRSQLLEIQRTCAIHNTLVAEGRDMGTVVFPHAQYKFFITATLTERAKRWKILQKKTGITLSQEQAEQELATRDTHDTTRIISPLAAAPGAIIIDTTHLTIEQVITKITEHLTREYVL